MVSDAHVVPLEPYSHWDKLPCPRMNWLRGNRLETTMCCTLFCIYFIGFEKEQHLVSCKMVLSKIVIWDLGWWLFGWQEIPHIVSIHAEVPLQISMGCLKPKLHGTPFQRFWDAEELSSGSVFRSSMGGIFLKCIWVNFITTSRRDRSLESWFMLGKSSQYGLNSG